MSASGPANLVEITSEVVAAYMANNRVPAGEIPALIATVHTALARLGEAPALEAPPAKPAPPVPIRKTITDEHIISLEDGKPYKALKRHLAKLGMTPAEYRARWGLPADYPMVAASYSAARSAQAKKLGLGSMRRRRRPGASTGAGSTL